MDWRNTVANPELKQEFADQAWQILDLAMANEPDSEFFAMRIVSAAEADRANETIQSMRGYIATVDFQLTGVEEGYISPTFVELDLKVTQINAVSKILAELAEGTQIRPSVRADIANRLQALVDRMQPLLLSAE